MPKRKSINKPVSKRMQKKISELYVIHSMMIAFRCSFPDARRYVRKGIAPYRSCCESERYCDCC